MEKITKGLVNWASILEDATREQALATSRMPFIFPHVALMPDAHLGKGATVGSVIPTLGAIIPAAVGVDIGCGMIAVRTQLAAGDLPDGPSSRCGRRSSTRCRCRPGKYNTDDHPRPHERARRASWRRARRRPASTRRRTPANWRLQLGTLGSGNHFIEVSLDESDRVWLFLHSGLARRRQQDRQAPHQGRAASCASSGGSSCPTATSPTSCRAPTSSGPTSASCGGRRSSRCSTARR